MFLSGNTGGLGAVGTLLYLVIVVFYIVCMYKVYEKANYPGWAAIIPIYNLVVLFQIAGLSPWLILAMIIPVVNIIIAVILYLRVAENFGKGAGFAVGLIFLSFIFIPILAFDDSTYVG